MSKYKVLIHRRVAKFLKSVMDEKLKNKIKESIEKLVDYPIILRELDVEKLEDIERTYRIRLGAYRVIFYVDKRQKTIYITHAGKRESIYED
ncbi:MAG: type II toxin-antitoxin system RelE family toxin [Nitrososphaerales archaeon]